MYPAVAAFSLGLSLVNLLLIMLTIRMVNRLREQRVVTPQAIPVDDLPIPRTAPEFSVRTVAGEILTRQNLLGTRSIIAFLAPGCPGCSAQIGTFKSLAFGDADPGRNPQLIGVVVGGGDSAAAMSDELAGVAHVVVEFPLGPLVSAFTATSYPSFYLIDADGVIQARERNAGAVDVKEAV